jgi:hypothetical protein
MLSRRAAMTALLALPAARLLALPAVRRITRGPKHHWFGYYDKLQFDASGRYVLGMQVDFEHRSPRPDDIIQLGVIDLQDNDRWTRIGETRSWNWQQGAMLQWLPGTRRRILWNERGPDGFRARILDYDTGKSRVLAAPVYTVSPDGKSGVAPDFRRLNDCRPGYGYAGIQDPNAGTLIPKDAGIWRVDLESGKSSLAIPLAEAAAVAYPPGYPEGAKHWFNHLLYNTDGTRFVFLHRWRGAKEPMTKFSTRMFTASADGSDLYVLDPHGRTSHFIWRDPNHVLAWAWHPSKQQAFYLYRDRTDQVEVVGEGVMTVNGHCTYLPGGKYILNDTYPDANRNQNVYLFEVATGQVRPLGSFYAPPEYTGEWRCDTHPRSSADGKLVCVDSAHEGGRQMYLIDVAAFVKAVQ